MARAKLAGYVFECIIAAVDAPGGGCTAALAHGRVPAVRSGVKLKIGPRAPVEPLTARRGPIMVMVWDT